MKKTLIQLCLALSLGMSSTIAVALSDGFYTTGEDLDILIESKSTFAIEEIEYKLREFKLYRDLENLLYDLTDEYPGISQF